MTPQQIKSLRLKLKLTRAQFGALINESYSNVYRWEKGLMGLHKSTKEKLEKLGRKV